MDLNDPRRRLQVLNNASPSIRIASQPQQKLTVAKAPTQQQPQISIAQPKQYNIAVPKNPSTAPAQPQYTNKFKGLTNEGTETKKLFGFDVGRFMGDYGKVTKLAANRDFESDADSFLASYDKLGDDARRIYVNDVIKKAKAGDEVAINTAKVLNDKGKLTGTFGDFLEAANNKAFGWTMNASNFNKQKDVQDRLDNFTAGQIGKEFDPITVGTDIGLTIAGGMGAAKLLSKIPAAQRVIAAGGTAGKVLPFLADSVGGGLTQEAISQARGRDTSFAQDMATGTAIDVGANLVFKGAGKFTNLFRQGQKSSSVVADIIQESDPAVIQQVMKIDNNLANYLAQETNPNTVKEVLRQMELDPNIQLPDGVRKRLEEEGISAVRKKDNQYGAEYDPNDSSINFRDQSFATDENTYHELGHHIFKTKLTPEEQALFKGTGEASQKAAGREGYTPADVNSEDFSDYMQKALTGRIKDVPEEVRPVIQKYAKIAAQEADNVGIAGIKATDAPTTDFKTKVNSKVNQELFDQGLVSGKIFEKNINDLKLGPNTDPTEAPDMAQVAKYIDDISNGKPIDPVIVERGPNGELLVDDGKHRLEALKALGIEDVPVIEKGAKSAVPTPEQAVGDVAKAQTGVSDAAPDGSVKTTSLEDAGTTFADNYNGNLKKPTPTPQVTKTPTVDPTAALKQEALKYKSADEFVKAKTNAYHGSDATFESMQVGRPTKRRMMFGEYDTTSNGMFFTPDPKVAREYGQNVGGYHANVQKPLVFSDRANDGLFNEFDRLIANDKNIDIKPGEPGFQEFMYFDGELGKKFTAFAKSKGFDGAKLRETSEFTGEPFDSIVAFDNNLVLNDEQLTDLYNQAHTEAKTTAPKVEAPQVTKTEPTTVYHGGTPQKAEEIVPNADDETKRAVQEVLDNLNGAQKNFDDAAKIRTQQKAARINSADGAFQSAGGGEAGFRAKLGALKGKYAESGFNPITASESTQNTILNDIESSSLRSFEKLNLQNAMRKIWGATEGKPTPGEINQIRKYFGEDGEQIAKAIEDAVAEDPKTWRDKIVDIAGIPRAAMASFDFSMGLRQGGQVAVRNFPDWVNANKESIKYVKNADYFKSEMKRIADDDAYETIVDKLGVRLPAVEGNSDEIMASANLLEKIPVYGRGIEASDRAYSGGLTKLRYNIAKKWIDSLGGTDEALKNLSEKDLRDIGEVINTSTGSGGKKGGFTEKHMQTLATTLFAPRLWASRLNAINPAYYARLSPIARRRAIENIASFMGAAGVVVGLADAAGMDVEMDPRSSDFMKIKTGNTRFDIFGGLQQNVVFFARMITGEKKNSSTGEIQTMGDGFGQPTRLDLAQDMLQNKLNPLLGYAARMLQSSEGDTGNPNDRKDRFGEDINVAKETGKLVVPLGIQGLADSYNDTGDPVKAAAMNIPNFFGIGTQTYGETATKDQKTDSNGKIAFGGKIQDNMVLDNEGNVFLDEKNRPVKVKFDKDASEVEKKAALKKAANEAYTKKAKSLLSQEDADLYATGQADPNSLDQTQKDKFDQIKKWVSDYGKSVDIPKSVKSDAAKNFYAKYNTMTKKDQKNWLKESPDENAKTVATELNKQRVKGLPEYKPSNYLSKEYAEYEKDLLEHPEYTNIDKQNKARAFQAKAYKYNYSEDQRDIFNEGGSSDLKSLIDDGQISKEDLSAAIKLDEELYNSGLTGSLKFSKKFRNTYGYGTPAGRGGSGSGGSGGGSGSGESKRAYLSAYVSNGTEGAKKEAPQFSSKRRTTGISFKDVSTPKKSNSKKVTINL